MERVTGIVATTHPGEAQCREVDMRAWVEDTPLPLHIRDTGGHPMGQTTALRLTRLEDGCIGLIADMELVRPCGQFAAAHSSTRPWGKGHTGLKAIVTCNLLRDPHLSRGDGPVRLPDVHREACGLQSDS